MTDVFISYSRADRDRAQTVARALEKQGFTVWWDRKIPPGKTFDEVIQEALQTSSCVTVLWSTTSVKSDWVKEEAQNGAARGVLVPVLIDDVPIPLGFGRIQTANLVGWRGDLDHPEFEQLSRSVAEIGGLQLDTRSMTIRPREASAQPPRAETPPLQRRASDAAARSRPKRRLPAVAAALGLLVAVAAGLLYANDMVPWPPGGDQEEPPVEPPIPGPSGPAAEPEPGIATADPPRESPAGQPLPTPEEDKAAEEAQRRRDETPSPAPGAASDPASGDSVAALVLQAERIRSDYDNFLDDTDRDPEGEEEQIEDLLGKLEEAAEELDGAYRHWTRGGGRFRKALGTQRSDSELRRHLDQSSAEVRRLVGRIAALAGRYPLGNAAATRWAEIRRHSLALP
jgi:hypothetical protein